MMLAQDLARLMDDMTTRQVDWARLDGLVPEELDRYWQLTLDFLKLIHEPWRALLAEQNRIEPAERRDRLIEAEQKRLAEPPGPGDRGGIDRLDSCDRETARDHRAPSARRGDPAGPRHRA